jgi:hypothetical protein
MKTILRRWFPRHAAATPGDDLPEALATGLVARSFATVQADVQAFLGARPDALDRLLTEAEGRGWPSLELEKLTAFGHFYRGDLGRAFSSAAPRCGRSASEPFDPDLFMVALLSLYHNHQYEDAWQLVVGLGEREAAYFSDRAEYFSIKSSAALANNRVADAWAAIQVARRLRPDDALIALNAYALAFRLPDMEVYRQLSADISAGRFGGGHNALAVATPVLAQDDYREGFRLLEGRYLQPDAGRYVNPALPAAQRWSGQAAEWSRGKTLLLSCEQGLGDTIQMARYFPALEALAEGMLVIETHPELLSLLSHCYPTLRFVARQHGQRPPADFDCWIGSLSLPYIFGSTAADIPGRAGYLTAAEENRAYWRARLDEAGARGPRIGIAWAGNPAHNADRQRSIAGDEVMAHLRRRAGLDFFALQTSVPSAHPGNLHDVSAELLTFSDTAALVEQMDLVITVDTSVVHIAGALGKETWLLLPKRYEWRWSLEGEGNRWYESVRVLRQVSHGDWTTVLHQVFDERLEVWLRQRSC